MSNIDVFISHSSRDAEFLKLMNELITSSLQFAPDRIRSTSVKGYEGGAKFHEKLRKDILQSKVLIAIITPFSVESEWMPFELGAFWAKYNPKDNLLIPVLAYGANEKYLRGPLKFLNAYDSRDRGDLIQLVEQLQKFFSVNLDSLANFSSKIEEIVEESSKIGRLYVEFTLEQRLLKYLAQKRDEKPNLFVNSDFILQDRNFKKIVNLPSREAIEVILAHLEKQGRVVSMDNGLYKIAN